MNEQYALLAWGALLALGGSLVQAFVSWVQSHANRRRDLLIDAYKDFLSGVAQRASILQKHSERTEAATALLITGKQKITAYAPAKVVDALAKFERTPQQLSESSTQTAMVKLVQAMRSSVGVKSAGMEAAVHSVLFGGTKFISDESIK